MLIFEEYKSYHKKYFGMYGRNVIVFMQIGLFYGAFSMDDLDHFKRISQLINCNSWTNGHIIGFPVTSVKKCVDTLTNNGMIVVLIDSVLNRENNIVRVVSQFFPQQIKFYHKTKTKQNYNCNICLHCYDLVNVVEMKCGHELCLNCANDISHNRNCDIDCPFCADKYDVMSKTLSI